MQQCSNIPLWSEIRWQTCGTAQENVHDVLVKCQQADLKYTKQHFFVITQPFQKYEMIINLTCMQLEEELDSEVIELTAVLNDLDERREPTLAWCERGDGNGAVELSNHWDRDQKRNIHPVLGIFATKDLILIRLPTEMFCDDKQMLHFLSILETWTDSVTLPTYYLINYSLSNQLLVGNNSDVSDYNRSLFKAKHLDIVDL